MDKNKYTIWHDADYDLAYWVHHNTILNQCDTIIRSLPKETKFKQIEKMLKKDSDGMLLPLIKYEISDIIITCESEEGNRIICVSEFMMHTPQWQHPVQRFARVYGATNMQIPSAVILPNSKTKLEKKGNQYREVIYRLSDSVKYLFYHTSKLTKTPTMIFGWGDKRGHLKLDKKHPSAPSVGDDVSAWCQFVNDLIMKLPLSEQKLDIKKIPTTENFDTISGIYDMDEFLEKYGIEQDSLDKPIKNKVLVFAPNGLSPPSSYFRTDPYAGMLCAFDNLFCRNIDNGNRDLCLALIAENVKLDKLLDRGTFKHYPEHNKSECPFENIIESKEYILRHIESGCPHTQSKQQKIYGQVADVIIFDDKKYSYGKEI